MLLTSHTLGPDEVGKVSTRNRVARSTRGGSTTVADIERSSGDRSLVLTGLMDGAL